MAGRLRRLPRLFGFVTEPGVIQEVAPPTQDVVQRGTEQALKSLGFAIALAVPRLILFIIGMFFSHARGIRLPSGGSRAPLQPVYIPVQSFRIRTPDARLVQCVLRGDLGGGTIHLGDVVVIRGRVSFRTKLLKVKVIRDQQTGARLRGRVPAGGRFSALKGLLGLLAGVMVLLFILNMCSGPR